MKKYLEAVKKRRLLKPRTSLAKSELHRVMMDAEALCSPVFPSCCVGALRGGRLGELHVCDDTEHCHVKHQEGP